MIWAGLPPTTLGPSVLDKRVGTSPIVTHMPMANETATEELWQINAIKH